MSKAILISIRHKWNKKIFALKKHIEVRKSAPKCRLPVKVYIYEPIGKGDGCGKVVGEYTLWSIVTDKTCGHDDLFNAGACLTEEEATAYANGKHLKGWVVENPIRYDKPRELSEFLRPCDYAADCGFCEHAIFYGHDFHDCGLRLTRPPQSWCYVEEQEG